jgi:SAM-dependent methyltransferase
MLQAFRRWWVQRTVISPVQAVRLDVGCGSHKQEGFVGMDRRRLPGVDIVHDIEDTPWPLPDNCCTAVVLSHVWEHITPKHTLAVMEEIHRICRDGASVFISAPYAMGSRYMQDPTHCNPSTEATWMYWDPEHPLYGVYQPSPFKVLSYNVIPVSNDRDFNCVLRVLKPTGVSFPQELARD